MKKLIGFFIDIIKIKKINKYFYNNFNSHKKFFKN